MIDAKYMLYDKLDIQRSTANDPTPTISTGACTQANPCISCIPQPLCSAENKAKRAASKELENLEGAQAASQTEAKTSG